MILKQVPSPHIPFQMRWTQVLTNGLYKSVPHQAVVNRSQSRISLAYFFAPSKEAKVAPIPDLVRNDKKLYKTFTIEEYLAVKRGQLLNTLEHFEIQHHEQQI